MTHTNKIGVAILLSTALICPFGFAASCYEQSPNHVSLGDKYFDLYNNTPLTDSDKRIINSALKKMVGNWKGKGREVYCIGPEPNPVVENKPFTLSARISTNSSNELHIDAEKYLLDDKIKSQEHMFFFGANSYQSVSVTPNRIVLVERFRQERIEEQKKNKKQSDKESKKGFDKKEAQKKIRALYESIRSEEHTKTHISQTMNRPTNNSLTKDVDKKKVQKKIRPFYELIHTIEHTKTHFSYTLSRYINGSLAIEETWQLVRN